MNPSCISPPRLGSDAGARRGMPAAEAVTQIAVTCWDGSKPARRGARLGQGVSQG